MIFGRFVCSFFWEQRGGSLLSEWLEWGSGAQGERYESDASEVGREAAKNRSISSAPTKSRFLGHLVFRWAFSCFDDGDEEKSHKDDTFCRNTGKFAADVRG